MPKPTISTSGASTLKRKLLFGVIGASTAAIVGSAGIAAAQTASTPMPKSKADCAQFQKFGFKNRGQCVSFVEHNVLHHGNGNGNGSGYGGGNNNRVNTTVNMDVSGNHNIISIVLNYMFG